MCLLGQLYFGLQLQQGMDQMVSHCFPAHNKCLLQIKYYFGVPVFFTAGLRARGAVPLDVLPYSVVSSIQKASNAPANTTPCAGGLWDLCSQLTGLHLTTPAPWPTQYKLPTVANTGCAKTILDPSCTTGVYELPTSPTTILEKVNPSSAHTVPIEDPNPLQRIIDEGAPTVEKHAMPMILRIRRKKMKKHKLKKMRRRNIFLIRRLGKEKKRKKDMVLQDFEKRMQDIAEQFDADKYVDERINLARKGGWGIDVLQSRKRQTG